METLPFYRIKQLIVEKYGEEKFATGCALVAWWLSYQTKEKVNTGWVKLICDIKGDHPNPGHLVQLTGTMAKALKDIFKLQSYKELYTLPESTPEFFN